MSVNILFRICVECRIKLSNERFRDFQRVRSVRRVFYRNEPINR